jgi:hypothetical protein
MLNNKQNARTAVFSLPLFAHLKYAIPPEQIMRHHRDKRWGGMGGQAFSLHHFTYAL